MEQNETTVEAPSPNGSEPETPTEEKLAKRDVSEMFRYSTYLHVGPGAEECEDRENGNCGNPLHFHCWCRLPNKFQKNSIQEKAQAAKARRIRQLRDPESDGFAILAGDIEALREMNSKEALVDELLQKTYARDHLEAMKEVAEEEEFENIDADMDHWRELNAKTEEERDKDEYDSLMRHLEKWNEAVDAKRDEKQAPQREALEVKPVEELIELLRDDKIGNEGNAAFMASYSKYSWFLGTLMPREGGLPKDRAFSSIEELHAAAPEVIEAIEVTFQELESESFGNQQTALRAEGNS